MIYFIQAADGPLNPVKIGKADYPGDRLAALQTAHHQLLRIIGVLPGGLDEEADLHSRFAADRIRNEWFAPSPVLMAFIATLPLCAEPMMRPAAAQPGNREAIQRYADDVGEMFRVFLTEFYADKRRAARDIARMADTNQRTANNWLAGRCVPSLFNLAKFAKRDKRVARWFWLILDATNYAELRGLSLAAGIVALLKERAANRSVRFAESLAP